MRVLLVAVVSLDGCLTRHDAPHVTDWASPEDKAHFLAVNASCDASIMGSATYLAERDRIRDRLRPTLRRVVSTRDPGRFADDAVPGQLEFSDEDPTTLVSRLRSLGHRRCSLMGGGQIYNAHLGAGTVDEVLLSVEPVFLGDGVRLATGSPIDARFVLDGVEHLNASTLLLRYRRP